MKNVRKWYFFYILLESLSKSVDLVFFYDLKPAAIAPIFEAGAEAGPKKMALRNCCTLVASAVWHQFRFLAREAVVVEDLVFSAADEARMSFYAGDQTVAVSGNWESREWPEFGGLGVRRYFGWAFEADDSWKFHV